MSTFGLLAKFLPLMFLVVSLGFITGIFPLLMVGGKEYVYYLDHGDGFMVYMFMSKKLSNYIP